MRHVAPSLLCAFFLVGTTGCDPCREIDTRLTHPVTGAPSATQIVLSMNGLGLSSRAGDAFRPGSTTLSGGRLMWETLAVTFTPKRSEARVGLRVERGGAGLIGGTLRFPVEVVATPTSTGFTVGLKPAGASELSLADDSDGSALLPELDAMRGSLVGADSLARFDGWFAPGNTLPLSFSEPVVQGSVVRIEIATGLPAAALDAGERALRPGMADDFTLAVSMDLLSQLSRAGYLPTTRTPLPSAVGMDGWRLMAETPAISERGLSVPVLAREEGHCVYVEIAAETKPGTRKGGLGWKPAATRRVSHRGEVEGDAAIARAALDGLAAPLSVLPLRGPASHQAQARLVRRQGNGLLLDGVLGPIKARTKRRPPPPPGLRGPPTNP